MKNNGGNLIKKIESNISILDKWRKDTLPKGIQSADLIPNMKVVFDHSVKGKKYYRLERKDNENV